MVNHNIIKKRLSELRNLMHEIKADYYYIPSTDPHKNEYIPTAWKRRAFISGFTGSAGDAVVGLKEAYLWTDPRYFLQAEHELDPSLYKLMKMGKSETPTLEQWLSQHKYPIVFAVDPQLISIQQAKQIEQALIKNGGKLISIEKNLIDQIWKDRPSFFPNTIRIQSEAYSGQSAENKLIQLRKILKTESANAIILNTLDAIAWLFNIRGDDITYNPLVISYAVITEKEAILFVDFHKVTDEIQNYFKRNGVTIKPYEIFSEALHSLAGAIWVDPTTTSWWIEKQIQNTAHLIKKTSPITLSKAIKNHSEQEGARTAHIIDAIAMIKFLYWLDTHWQSGITEISASEQLEAFRRENSRCLGLSFSTISGFGPHSAIIHYSPTPETNSKIDDSSIYLIDSGGQYQEGTTDITRTIHLGTPTEKQRVHYTLVLKGHLAIRRCVFPKGRCGEHIDAFARQFLWNHALDYGHGTGHGVGSYLCVHEGPQSISGRHTDISLEPGMIVSNEPGLYLDNQYGIRIENLCLVTEKFSARESIIGDGPFYTFEDLTMVPYCRKLIRHDDLTAEEIKQINNYHQQVQKVLNDYLENTSLKEWLAAATSPL